MPKLTADWNVEVKVQNRDGLIANLRAHNVKATRAVLNAIGESAARLEQRTIDLCPKDTFFMSEHVRTDFSDNGYTFETGWDAKDFLGTFTPKGQPRSFYPFYVEFGTRHMRAQPSLSIAFNEEVPRYKQALADAMAEAMGSSGT